MSSASEAAKNNGNAAFAAKNYPDAIKFFTEAIAAEPKVLSAFYAHVLIHVCKGRILFKSVGRLPQEL